MYIVGQGHTIVSLVSLAFSFKPCFKLMVSTPESDPYMSSSLKDQVLDEELSKGSENMVGGLQTSLWAFHLCFQSGALLEAL
jgi:hypothetical protein